MLFTYDLIILPAGARQNRLTVDDVFVTDEGLRVNVRHSKTHQAAQGQQIAIPDGKMQAVDVLFG